MSAVRLSATVAYLLLSTACFAQVSSTDLIEKAKALDGREVEFTGECIGDVMPRGDHLWVNLSDGANALGVWMAREDLPPLHSLGSYRERGDTLTVRGIFRRSCPDHGGDMDIHAFTATVIKPGTPTAHPVSAGSIIVAAILILASLASFILWKKDNAPSRPPSVRGYRGHGIP
jgi:hypothetical protein